MIKRDRFPLILAFISLLIALASATEFVRAN